MIRERGPDGVLYLSRITAMAAQSPRPGPAAYAAVAVDYGTSANQVAADVLTARRAAAKGGRS